jgi:hypothetical protein
MVMPYELSPHTSPTNKIHITRSSLILLSVRSAATTAASISPPRLISQCNEPSVFLSQYRYNARRTGAAKVMQQ